MEFEKFWVREFWVSELVEYWGAYEPKSGRLLYWVSTYCGALAAVLPNEKEKTDRCFESKMLLVSSW